MDIIGALRDPIFLAKVVDFAIFVGAIVFVYERWGKRALVVRQEAQNKAVEDADAHLARAKAAVEEARRDIDRAEIDASHMVDVGTAQAQRLMTEERAIAQAHVQRVLAHASGELARERYRVRLEVLEETVERATSRARELIGSELTPVKQDELVQTVLDGLEAQHV